jgi:protein-S-isoprenylcysteine O-methyltransferase Ste14
MKSMQVRKLVGSGDRIAVATLPFAVVAVALHIAFPSWFDVSGPPPLLRSASIGILVVGIVVWIWSGALILRHVPRGELITTGPFAMVRHPLYTGVSLLVVPWLGFLLNTWIGAAIGIVMYVAARRYARAEERELAETFGDRWAAYRDAVLLPWV